MPRGGKREGAGRKPGGRNERTIRSLSLRDQMLNSSYPPLVVFQKNIEWSLREAEQLEKALEPLNVVGMDAAKIEALNETRRQIIALRATAADVASKAAPYVQPRPATIDEPVTLDIKGVEDSEDLVKAHNYLALAVAHGEISPDEGAKVSVILESRRKALELLDIERRLVALEAGER
jgi:hypothetical protein